MVCAQPCLWTGTLHQIARALAQKLGSGGAGGVLDFHADRAGTDGRIVLGLSTAGGPSIQKKIGRQYGTQIKLVTLVTLAAGDPPGVRFFDRQILRNAGQQ